MNTKLVFLCALLAVAYAAEDTPKPDEPTENTKEAEAPAPESKKDKRGIFGLGYGHYPAVAHYPVVNTVVHKEIVPVAHPVVVEKPVHVPVKVPVAVPVHVPVVKHVPIVKHVPYPVAVKVPVAVPIVKHVSYDHQPLFYGHHHGYHHY